jgi:hypothetical protein
LATPSFICHAASQAFSNSKQSTKAVQLEKQMLPGCVLLLSLTSSSRLVLAERLATTIMVVSYHQFGGRQLLLSEAEQHLSSGA